MTAAFLYALPQHVTLQQEAAVARGLRELFPNVDFEAREGTFLTGDIMAIASRPDEDGGACEPPPRLLTLEVKTAFAGLLIDALARASEPAIQFEPTPVSGRDGRGELGYEPAVVSCHHNSPGF